MGIVIQIHIAHLAREREREADGEKICPKMIFLNVSDIIKNQ